MHASPPPTATGSDNASRVERPILVPVDFSSCSRAALRFAADFIRCVSAPLLVLHVIHEAGNEPGFYRKYGTPGALRPVEDIARDMLKEFVADICDAECRDASGPVEPRLLLVSGLPAARIREIAEREQAGLIVMGTHARTGLARIASGSVSTEVMQHCRVPVTIVKAAPARREADGSELESTGWWQHEDAVPDGVEHKLA